MSSAVRERHSRNATDHGGSGGSRSWATLSVTDDGPGIAAADLPRVFDRFWRGAGAGAAAGSGIGLTVARALARAHGVDVTVRSQVERGSAFTVSLPLARP